MKFLAYFGHLNIDVLMSVDTIPREGSVNVRDLKQRFGGTAGNFAMIARRIGVPFDVYSVIGMRTHRDYYAMIEGMGIATEHIERFDDENGPICYIATDGKRQVAFMHQGPMEKWRPNLAEDYEYVHFSTGPNYLDLARNTHAKIVFDPSQEIGKYSSEELREFYDLSYISIFNDHEYRLFREKTGIATAKNITIVTSGEKGSTLFMDGRKQDFPAIPSSGDTVGAGDSFRAGIYLALFSHRSLEKGMIYGTVIAHHVIDDGIEGFTMDSDELEKEAENYRRMFMKRS
ncbi:carbohydrate kinase family protein [Thermoplasma sp.]|uniref:carbohydrate kinase family protein n=1 Tax=Thermoplasma sp. TaxID=1973142 RepID=UPI001277B2D9|nr:carbohydrate kinase family protein [Thermoplasma sp.]KAA8923126.1 MAG: carbohydrate kinase family protein [Thermoplasma sp.]